MYMEDFKIESAELLYLLSSSVHNFCATFNHPARVNFLTGNCYWFARILQERYRPFFQTDIMYNPIQNHFCCLIKTAAGDYCADASGMLPLTSEWKLWSDYIAEEPLDAARVYRDCIWHIDEEKWNELLLPYRETPWLL